ncbi:hypothetical protein BCR33DRAFT_699587 [Rhizoclosmatium globosum]|uniref:Ribonuclease P/MRP protein subunit POP5 n=1 Tax=Rhizoclosmatium globosum TaxID=329046 RepID=A0A1Y2C000_9FUNG|nr:hypothetical protein BCR33DRAFT_699587 [Rhizoclosmatium globosum]|eukprot:ORY40207.1 hypothetical protein BCR33DRAFT_699587 [Rhizoclosmatium globosum]
MRFKNRYLAFQLLSRQSSSSSSSDRLLIHESINRDGILKAIKTSLEQNFGDMAVGIASNLSIKYFSPMTGVGILRVPRDIYKECWAAVTLVTSVTGERGERDRISCLLNVFHVAGTIKQAQINTIEHNKSEVLRLQDALKLSGSAVWFKGKGGFLNFDT